MLGRDNKYGGCGGLHGGYFPNKILESYLGSREITISKLEKIM